MLLSRSTQLALYIATLLGSVCVSADIFTKTYWLDKSCTDQGVGDAVKAAIYIAGRAAKRLDDPSDNNIDRTLQKVFQLSKSNPDDHEEIDLLKDRFGRQAGFTQLTNANDRGNSDYRIYCDEDTRWTPVPDIEGDPFPNSRRPEDKKEYEDTVNLMRLREGDILNSCRMDKDAMGFTVTSGASSDRFGHEKPGRHMTTLCKNAYENLPDLDAVTALVDLGGNDRDTLDYFDGLGYVTILHEFSHIRWAGNTVDDHENPTGGSDIIGYTWTGIQKLDAGQSAENADSHAYFEMLSFLMDYQWKISDNDNDAKAGKIVKDKNLPFLPQPQPIYQSPPESDSESDSPGKRSAMVTCKDLRGSSTEKRCVQFVA